MIKNLEIKNFKSIKHLAFACKKVNLFIGKPNTGKSNILECLGIFSLPYVKTNFGHLARFENMANLFYDQDLGHNIEVKADNFIAEIKFEKGKFILQGRNDEEKIRMSFDLDYEGKGGMGGSLHSPFKLYRFKVMEKFDHLESGFLLPPFGDNLLQLLLTNKDLRKTAASFYREYGLRLVLKPQEHKIEIQKEIDDVIISHPYALVSDTLQRIVFYLVAIETNKDSILIFEEPEAHAFPFYTKFLAERIALDVSNQYFITTHNPYLLLSILEKAPKQDIGIFITYYRDYQTKVRTIKEKELSELLDLDASIFFNLDRFLGEE